MATRKIEIRPPGSGDYGDVLYPKTSADIVVATMWGGLGTVQEQLDYLKDSFGTVADSISHLGSAASKDTGAASGQVPILGSGGKLDTSVLPALAITETHVVANQAAMLALTAQVGDVAVRTDLNKSFILKAEPAATLANWQELLTPTDAVTSVAGKTGVVTLTGSDVGLGSVQNYGLATKAEAEAGSSSAKYMTPLRTKEAVDALQAVKSVAGKTGEVTLAKGDVGLGNVDNTSDADKPISTAVQTALHGKVGLTASQNITGMNIFSGVLGIENKGSLGEILFGTAGTRLGNDVDGDLRIDDKKIATQEHVINSAAPAVHTHGNISTSGQIGAAANKPLITGAAGIIQAGSFGSAANTFCEGNDSRLSNARTPTTHTHTKSQITDFPTNISSFTNDKNFISSFLTIGTVQPTNGDLWFKELS